jgi:hypothetical protein
VTDEWWLTMKWSIRTAQDFYETLRRRNEARISGSGDCPIRLVVSSALRSDRRKRAFFDSKRSHHPSARMATAR